MLLPRLSFAMSAGYGSGILGAVKHLIASFFPILLSHRFLYLFAFFCKWHLCFLIENKKAAIQVCGPAWRLVILLISLK